MNDSRDTQRRDEETEGGEEYTEKSDDDIIVSNGGVDTSNPQRAPSKRSSACEKRSAPDPVQEPVSKRIKHEIAMTNSPQFKRYNEKGERLSLSGRGKTGGTEYDRRQLSRSLPVAADKDNAGTLPMIASPGRTQTKDASVRVPNSQHPPSPPDSDVQTERTKRPPEKMSGLEGIVSLHSDADATIALEPLRQDGHGGPKISTSGGCRHSASAC